MFTCGQSVSAVGFFFFFLLKPEPSSCLQVILERPFQCPVREGCWLWLAHFVLSLLRHSENVTRVSPAAVPAWLLTVWAWWFATALCVRSSEWFLLGVHFQDWDDCGEAQALLPCRLRTPFPYLWSHSHGRAACFNVTASADFSDIC